jgi:hypothetical protein
MAAPARSWRLWPRSWGRPGDGNDDQEDEERAPGPERRVMTALMNGLLWFGMFAIPMLIAVILRRLGRKYGADDRYTSGDPAQEPDYRRWA